MRHETSGRASLTGFIRTLLTDTIFARELHQIDVISLCKHPIFGEKLLVSQTQATQTVYNQRIHVFFFFPFLKAITVQGLLKFHVPVRLKCLVVAGLSGVPEYHKEGEGGRYG